MWFSEIDRILMYVSLRFVYSVICPFFYLFAVIIVKKCCICKFEPGERGKNASQCVLFRHWLMATLLPPDSNLGGVGPLLGKHYETVSCCYRCLGAKVGARLRLDNLDPRAVLLHSEFATRHRVCNRIH